MVKGQISIKVDGSDKVRGNGGVNALGFELWDRESSEGTRGGESQARRHTDLAILKFIHRIGWISINQRNRAIQWVSRIAYRKHNEFAVFFANVRRKTRLQYVREDKEREFRVCVDHGGINIIIIVLPLRIRWGFFRIARILKFAGTTGFWCPRAQFHGWGKDRFIGTGGIDGKKVKIGGILSRIPLIARRVNLGVAKVEGIARWRNAL